MLVRLETSEPIKIFIYLLLLFITQMAYHSDEDEEDDPAVEDLQSQFDDQMMKPRQGIERMSGPLCWVIC